MKLLEKYGYCVISKNSNLFHSGHINDNADSIFFGLDPITAKASPNSSNKIQVWRLKTDVKLLFMILEVAHYSWTKSAISEIYQYYFPEDGLCDDIEIKYNDRSKRKKFIDKLKQQEIIGWFSSFDDKYELEVCLFKNENLFNIIELLRATEMKEFYIKGFKNPLKNSALCPNDNFYKSSTSKLVNFPFSSYKKHILSCINEEHNLGSSKNYSQNANYTLRMKLKI